MQKKDKWVRLIVVAVVSVVVMAVLVLTIAFGMNIVLTPVARSLKDVGALSARVDTLEKELEEVKQRAALSKAPVKKTEDFNKVYDLPAGSSYILGKADASVTLIEFTDFQCPYCAYSYPLLDEIRKAFPDDVKIILKNFPLSFHPQARSAAKAAWAAGEQGKYYEMVALLMANNPDNMGEKEYRDFAVGKGLDPDQYINDLKEYSKAQREGRESTIKIEFPPRKPDFSAELYKKLAGELGLNVELFERDLKDKDAEFEKRINEDMKLGQAADVRGTPTYFLNGRKTRARDLASFSAEIQALLKK